eukprot:8588810-Pyramimonas_sp.AAC.1
MGRFLFLGALLGGLRGVLAASEAAWRPSWASRGDLSANRGPLGPSGEHFGAFLASFGALRSPVTRS